MAATKVWLGRKLWTKAEVSQRLQIHPELIDEIAHHESHAAQAFLGSKFEESAILIVDAVGEWSTTSLLRGQWIDGHPVFETLASSDYPNSLGLFYSAFTEFFGFRAMDDECSVMALSAFGKPTFANEVRKIVSTEKGVVSLSTKYFDFDRSLRSPFTQTFTEVFGEPCSAPFKFSAFEMVPVDSEEQRYADLAASVQLVFEEALLDLARFLKSQTGSASLCFAGGAALNCVAHSRLIREAGFQNIFVPIEPGDGGAAAGAAQLRHCQLVSSNANALHSEVFLGESHETTSLMKILPLLEIGDFRNFRKHGDSGVVEKEWAFERADSEDALMASVVAELIDSKVVGWFQGAFENGPRALGHRSLLIRPDSVALARRLSSAVKDRAPFRPYALAMTAAEALRILDETPEFLAQKGIERMQCAALVRKELQQDFRSGVHTDGTTRPQVVNSFENPKFHRLLEKFGKASGSAVLINTSFNESGYPIVNTPLEALLMFARTDLDVLVIEDVIVRKVRVHDSKEVQSRSARSLTV